MPGRRPGPGGGQRIPWLLGPVDATNNRHTLVTEIAESGAGDELIMSIAHACLGGPSRGSALDHGFAQITATAPDRQP
jgi:hypothetical protein